MLAQAWCNRALVALRGRNGRRPLLLAFLPGLACAEILALTRAAGIAGRARLAPAVASLLARHAAAP
jgi:hypothetical protein